MNSKPYLATLGISALALVTINTPYAAEVDSFTGSDQIPLDSTALLNAEVNQRLQQALQKANDHRPLINLSNEAGRVCNQEKFYSEAGKLLTGFVIGEIESYANELPAPYRRFVPLEESIYRDVSFLDAPSLVSKAALASIVQVNGVQVGADKFGHFFSDGFNYFKHHHLRGRTLDETMTRGELTELSYFGTMASGVYSYADLIANFNGMRFWNSLFARDIDELTKERPSPYLQCERGKLSLIRQFAWQDYVDSAWDERINCNRYETSDITREVLEKIRETGTHACRGEHSPKLEHLNIKYQPFSYRLINPQGGVIVKQFLDALGGLLNVPQPGHNKMVKGLTGQSTNPPLSKAQNNIVASVLQP